MGGSEQTDADLDDDTGATETAEDSERETGAEALSAIEDALRQWAESTVEVDPPSTAPPSLRSPLDLRALTGAERYDYFKRVVTETLEGTWDDDDKAVNVIGVRNFHKWHEWSRPLYAWNDSIVVCYKDGEAKCAEAFLATLDLAQLYNKRRPPSPLGVIHMADGHYDYKLDKVAFSTGKTVPLVLPDGEVNYWRDRAMEDARTDEEHVEAAFVGLRIRPGGLAAARDEWGRGDQVIAGGAGGPWRRFLVLLKSDPDGCFKYSLVHVAKLPMAPDGKLFLPVGSIHKPFELKPGDAMTDRLTKLLYRQIEHGKLGGYYPLGLSRSWHGGVHIAAPLRRDQVSAVTAGEVVAARLGDIDASKHKLGSPNFILLRHERASSDDSDEAEPAYWFSLYMHLQPLRGQEFRWAYRIERSASKAEEAESSDEGEWQDVAKAAKEALDKAREGEVAVFAPGAVAVAGGEPIGFASSYARTLARGFARQRMIHFEVFTAAGAETIIAEDDPHFIFLEQADEQAACNVEELLDMIDVDRDGSITQREVYAAYRDKGTAIKLRHVVVKHASEWFLDWSTALKQSDHWKKMLKDDEVDEGAETANAYGWWTDELADWGIEEKTVTNYHPIRFLRYLLETQSAEAESSPCHIPKGKVWLLPLALYLGRFVR